ncbi:MAG: hypothetical protein WD845_00075 [Pirellulales bacterium]
MIRNAALATAGALLLTLAGSARLSIAQEPVLEEFYGNGVHHYFSGDFGGAIAELDAAINSGSRDPRAYYFRGLAKLRMGYDGAADLQQGAALEASDTDQYYPVSRSLERVQGSTRQTIERYRSLARANAFAQQQRRNASRYQQLKEREQHVLRGGPPASATPATAIEPAPAIAQPAAPGATIVPPAAPAEAVAKPAVPAPPAAEDPFAADDVAAPTAPAPAPAAVTPAEMPADKPAAPELTDDPFGEPPATDEPAEKPAADAPAAPADDPFGDDPAEEMPADDKPAADEPAPAPADDPFGAPPADDAPASADDPFATP